MRIFIQRVQNASVSINNEIVGACEKGYVLLIGIHEQDTTEISEKMWDKIYKLRIFPDGVRHTGASIKDIEGGILAISQFTLYADCKKGNRPSFTKAAPPDHASELYGHFIEYAKRDLSDIQSGVFGADMKVSLINDGPFSIMLDSDELFPQK